MKPFIIGICGGSCSGKTTLACALKEKLGEQALVLKHDNYYRSRDGVSEEERKIINYDHPDAFETNLLVSHLKRLARGEEIECPIYDFSVHNRKKETLKIYPRHIIIVEGILIFENEELRNLFDLKVFIDAGSDIRIIRRIMRDIKTRGREISNIIDQYLKTVRPMHELYVEPFKECADIIVNGEKKTKMTECILKKINNDY